MSENSTKGDLARRSWTLVAILQHWVSSMWSWSKTAREESEGFWLRFSDWLFQGGYFESAYGVTGKFEGFDRYVRALS